MSSDLDQQWEAGSDLPSKSQRKREARAILELARRLVESTAAELERLPLDENIHELVKAAQGITQHVARKREIQFVAKQLRELDTEELQAAMEALDAPALREKQRQHRLESWREAVLRSDEGIFALRATHPHTDFQALRQLARKARGEQAAGRAPRDFRRLFRALAALDDEVTLPAAPEDL